MVDILCNVLTATSVKVAVSPVLARIMVAMRSHFMRIDTK